MGVAARLKTEKIIVAGTVQGVGFRPFLYRLAKETGVAGHVRSTGSGVEIFAEGGPEHIEKFVSRMKDEAPPLSRIDSISVPEGEASGLTEFQILESEDGREIKTVPPPDVAACDECLEELFNPSDRRFLYPFINCTNCGPRYTIIKALPYDRENTTMNVFKMCSHCLKEYTDPQSRRFHAQPVSCWKCGPSLMVLNSSGKEVKSGDPIRLISDVIREGKIVGIRGIGGFHLVCDATNADTVKRLREKKAREGKPFAVMVEDIETANEYVFASAYEDILTGKERPVVLLEKKVGTLPDEIAPGLKRFGVMLPYAPIHYLLFARDLKALVMTSGNRGGEPISASDEEAVRNLAGIVDCFLVHNREIEARTDDSVIIRVDSDVISVRRARGYAPSPIVLSETSTQSSGDGDQITPRIVTASKGGLSVLGCGADPKNTFCLLRENHAFLSPHIGDIENLATLEHFRNTLLHLESLLEIRPNIVACDLHPDYFTTRFALEEIGGEKIQIQHHHAHIASCMAENLLDGEAIGIALDGTGFGTDGRIWGGEVLIASFEHAKRVGHIEEFPLPGGEMAIKEPWRVALSLLYKAFGEELFYMNLPTMTFCGETKAKGAVQMIRKRVNCPLTTSAGRVFDAVSSILGVRHMVQFEGQAAMELEACIDGNDAEPYPYTLLKSESKLVLGVSELVRQIVADFLSSGEVSRISARFHASLVNAFSQIVSGVSQETGLKDVVLSGGVFQNVHMVQGIKRLLEGAGLRVHTHKLVPPNDGGISLGQAVIASRLARKR